MQNKKLAILFIFLLSLLSNFSRAQSASAILAYIARYKDLAIEEMQRTGIPAAITLAQGIHETEAGTSVLVKKSNNHFGIKCKENWTGQSVSHDDDARGECFRKYAAPEESYRDHSDFLKSRPNYASLFRLDPTDYEAWANGLKKAGYATNPKYAQVLIKLIRDYNLQDYTLIAMGKMKQDETIVKTSISMTEKNQTPIASKKSETEQEKPAITSASIGISYPSGEFKINETRVIYAKKGTSYLTVAQQYEIPLARLFEFNDLKPQEVTADDQLVFIQRKRKIGDHESHTVQAGETVYTIAQTEAIRLESLLEYNNMGSTMQPAVGETLNLRSKSSSTPKLAVKNSLAGNLSSASQAVVMNDNKPVQRQAGQNGYVMHAVQSKETVYSIARKYNVTAEDLANWNQLQDYDLKIGQSLKIYR